MEMMNATDEYFDIQHEYFKEELRMSSATKAKGKAIKSLKHLQGWCTEFKASILIDFIYMLKPEKIVEVGVFGGSSLVPMAFALKENARGKIFGIDPWSSIESADGMEGVNKNWWSSVDHEQVLRRLQDKINFFELNEQIELIRSTSEMAEPIDEIDILHIDGNHSEKASYLDVNKWVPFVKKGGLIVFDDISWGTTDKAVRWLDEHCTKLVEFKDDCVWGIWVKP